MIQIQRAARLSAAALLASALSACPNNGGPGDQPDGGSPNWVDTCGDTLDKACPLNLGDTAKQYIYPSGDLDWYVIDVPASGLPANPLLRVQGGYAAPSTPVTLMITAYQADGKTSLGTVVDEKPRGAPGPIDIAFRLPGAGKIYLLVRDDTSDNNDPAHGDMDSRNQYAVTATVIPDPDPNEPNDKTPSPITIGTQVKGSIATPGDVDTYALNIAGPKTRQLLYIKISAPALSPVSRVWLEYTLTDSAGVAKSAGRAVSAAGGADLETVRALPPGSYTLTIDAYHLPTDPIQHSDPRLVYTIDTALYDEVDVQDYPGTANDTFATASVKAVAAGASASWTGRISSIADHDVYAVDLPARGAPMRLFYQVTRGSGGGRFAVGTTQLRATYFTQHQSQNACIAECGGTCDSNYICDWSNRVETSSPANMVAMVPVWPGAAQRVYLMVNADGDVACDDKDYTLTATYKTEAPDEVGGYNNKPSAATAIGAPGGGGPWTYPGITGYMSYGRGQTADPIPSTLIPQGGLDADALEDEDWYVMPLPAFAADVAMNVSWHLPTASVGSPPAPERLYDIAIQPFICADAACSSPQERAVVGYNPSVADWNPASGTMTLKGSSCNCLPSTAAAGTKMYVKVTIVNRGTYDDLPYTINIDLSPTRDPGCTLACQQ